MVNTCYVKSNGRKTAIGRGLPQVKFYDLLVTGSFTNSGSITASRLQPSQGIAVNQRTGDVVYIKKMWMNYSLSIDTAIDGAVARLIVFQWHPNSSVVLPIVNDILQTSTVYSMYDWNFSDQFRILYDKVHFLSGAAMDNTTGSNQGYFGEVQTTEAVKLAEFGLGATTGSQQLFILLITDVLVAPFPSFVIQTRVSYCEE